MKRFCNIHRIFYYTNSCWGCDAGVRSFQNLKEQFDLFRMSEKIDKDIMNILVDDLLEGTGIKRDE